MQKIMFKTTYKEKDPLVSDLARFRFAKHEGFS